MTACSKEAAYLGPSPGGEMVADNGTSPVYLEYNAIVTVKQEAGGRIYFQLDDNNILYPVNYTAPFTRQRRIICGLSWWSDSNQCTVHWMDFLQEGTAGYGYMDDDAPEGGSYDEDYLPGGDTPPEESAPDPWGDEIDVLDDWMTTVEDGYLTLHYSTFWGDGNVAHTLMLIFGENPEDPYEVRLLHLRNGDPALTEADALVYFDLAELPSTGGGACTLTLKWKNGSGETAKSFLYKSRQ